MRNIRKLIYWVSATVLSMFVLEMLPPCCLYAETVAYTYDSTGRLLKADYGAGKTVTYTYDKAGNILTEAVVLAIAPTVTTTAPITVLTTTTAAGGGNVTSDGGAAVTARGVCWSNSANPTTPCTTNGTGTGTFVSNLTGLTPNTTYHVRAYATNIVGRAYGSDVEFTTVLPGQYILIVTKSGTGGGTVTVNTGSLSWVGNTGSTSYAPDTTVELTATPYLSSSFIGWGGSSCSGNASPCALTMSEAKDVTATFDSKTDFIGTPRSGFVPLTVEFTDTSIHNPTSWYWEFGGGSTSTSKNPIHTYTSQGTFWVSLTAAGTGGAVNMIKNNYISVSACGNWPYKIGDTPHNFTTIQAAYDAMSSEDALLLQALEFTGGLSLDQNKAVTLKGGFGCDFTSNPGKTIVSDKLAISQGTVTIENLIVQ